MTVWRGSDVFVEKSRDRMIFWMCRLFTHAAMTNDEREVLFQSQKEDKPPS